MNENREKECYNSGWGYAENCWNDMIPYDENENSELSGVENECWVQGYYDFWVSKKFSLD